MNDVSILVAVTDAEGKPVQQNGPDGAPYPVLRAAPPSPLLDRMVETIGATFIAQAIRLDRFARRLVLREGPPAAEALVGPVYLFLSDEPGGFARHGFWLEAEDGQRSFTPAGYINMVVGETELERGFLESTFVHELAHLMLRMLVGKITKGPSRKMHQSMSVSDYPTALDEGWAEHFEPLIVDRTDNPWLLGRKRGRVADLIATWVNALDGDLRLEGVRRNLFVHEKPLPEAVLAPLPAAGAAGAPAAGAAGAPAPDPYRVWLEGETLGAFLSDRLKTGQAMLSSEGVAATLFYRIVTSKALQDRWEEPAFYAPFLPADQADGGGDPRDLFSPYENINLKLFTVMREMALRGRKPDFPLEPLDPHRPLLLDLIRTYAARFPADAAPLYQILVETTWGATASRAAAASLEALAYQGRIGSRKFVEGLHAGVEILDRLTADVAAGRVAPDANVGPELWVLNQAFLVPETAMNSDQRTLPLALNLNTASETDLMTIRGIELDLARAITGRRRELGYFGRVEDLASVPGISEALLESLRGMQQSMEQSGLHERT